MGGVIGGGMFVAMSSLRYLGTGAHFEGTSRRYRVGHPADISSADTALWLHRHIGLFMTVFFPRGALCILAIRSFYLAQFSIKSQTK